MTWVEIENELEGLERRSEELLATRLPHFGETSRRLAGRLGRRSAGAGWAGCFSPMVVLYPLLQAEIGGERCKALAREACLPHLLLLVHAFVDDRLIDRDLQVEREEILFGRQLFAEAGRLLGSLPGADAGAVASSLYDAVRYYCVAQMTPYEVAGDEDSVLLVVAGRAALGRVAMEVVTRASALPEASLEAARAAFDSVAIGLQWEDDLHDRSRDEAQGAENLLALLDGRPGGSPDARARASAHWERACGLLTPLGAHQLAALLKERATRLAASPPPSTDSRPDQ